MPRDVSVSVSTPGSPERVSRSIQRNGALDRDAVRADCIVLAGIVLFSTLPYLFSLGFYGDDWMYQGWFAHSSGQGSGGLLRTLLTRDPDLRVRPVQAICLVLGFKVFGRQPAGYHVIGSLILTLVPVVMYLVLRELRLGRWLAFTVPLAFGLLPHYSADRFWISSQQALLSMLFAVLGIYGMLRWRSGRPTASKAWVSLSIVAFVFSILSYEVPLGLIVASLGVIGFWRRGDLPTPSGGRWWQWLGAASLVLLAVGILKIWLQTRIHPHFLFLTRLGGLSWHASVEAVRFNFWTYGLHLPAVVASLYRHGALSRVALAAASGLGIFITAYLWTRLGMSQIPSRRACLWLIVAGFAIFGLGYALFFPNPEADFSSPGVANRITIASALGASCVLVGTVGLACSLLRSETARSRACAAAMGLICGVYCVVVSGISFFWVDASSQQLIISELFAQNLRSMPKGSVVFMEGFCRYSGPAVVFETDWDTTGALQLAVGDASLKGNVVSPDLRFGDTVVDPIGKTGEYAYGPDLFVYNLRRNTLTSLPSKRAALAYLSTMNPTQDSGCPQGRHGDGVKVF